MPQMIHIVRTNVKKKDIPPKGLKMSPPSKLTDHSYSSTLKLGSQMETPSSCHKTTN
jgi:hypothetical protein